MRFAFLEEEYGEPVSHLGPGLEEDLVGQMAEAILEVFKRGGRGTNERDSEEQ
jgi:hypothetical protein